MRAQDIKTSKKRARIDMLSEMLSFSHISADRWVSCCFRESPIIGDLVAMSSAPASKWYLSWLLEVNPNNGWPKYLLESVEDGEKCWWENIGISYYNRDRVANRPQWKWSDLQFEFNDRWRSVCLNKNNAYALLPRIPVFGEGFSVVLNVRVRFDETDYSNPSAFPDWRKISIRQMDEYYKLSLADYESKTQFIDRGRVK